MVAVWNHLLLLKIDFLVQQHLVLLLDVRIPQLPMMMDYCHWLDQFFLLHCYYYFAVHYHLIDSLYLHLVDGIVLDHVHHDHVL